MCNERDKKIVENIDLVKYLAQRYHISGRVIDRKDLIQEGVLGLIAAVDSYDKAKGPFIPYMVLIVTQYFVKAIRKNEGAFSVGNSMYRLLCVCKNFVLLNAREPTEDEFVKISKSVGVTFLNALTVYSGYSAYFGYNGKGEDFDAEVVALQKQCTRGNIFLRNNAVGECLNILKPQERYTIECYYYKDKTLKDISVDMGVSVSRVGNLKRDAEKKLKKFMQKKFKETL